MLTTCTYRRKWQHWTTSFHGNGEQLVCAVVNAWTHKSVQREPSATAVNWKMCPTCCALITSSPVRVRDVQVTGTHCKKLATKSSKIKRQMEIYIYIYKRPTHSKFPTLKSQIVQPAEVWRLDMFAIIELHCCRINWMAGSSPRDEERQEIIRAKSTMLPKNRFADGEKTTFFVLLQQLKLDQPHLNT